MMLLYCSATPLPSQNCLHSKDLNMLLITRAAGVDNLLRSIVSGIVNIHFDEDDPTWTQATQPVKNVVWESDVQCSLCLFGFSFCLLCVGLPYSPSADPEFHNYNLSEEAKIMWCQGHDTYS